MSRKSVWPPSRNNTGVKPKHPRWGRANWGALTGSLFLHLLIALIAILGLPRWSKPLPATPPAINASLVESPTAALRAKERAEQQERAEQERQRRLEAERKARIERERIAAEKRAREKANAEAQAEAERKAREKAEQVAREKAAEKTRIQAEQAAKAEADRKAKVAADRKAREEAEKRARAEAERKAKAEAARKAKEEADRKARAKAERKAREQKAREAAFAQELQAEQDAMDRASWSSRLGAHIQRFWVRPAGANTDFSCIVSIRQSRYGDVLARSIVRTCGNDFLDNSVLEAVDEASPLPLPRNPRVFDEVVDIEFVPF